ncbi:MAG: methyltransferase domain-containing protein, partial [Chloroflexi bacterium]|nr:methyltransferase domain-containing protein [Chloroflexota bacterium]
MGTVGASPAGRGPRLSFLLAFWRARKTIGAIAPSSDGLARRIAQLADVGRARTVVEFGPGTGAITRRLLEVLPSDGQLWAFEVYPPFIAYLREAIRDPRLTVVGESAERVTQLRGALGSDVERIISAVPFSLLPKAETQQMLRASASVLHPAGIFLALQYHPRYLAPLLRNEFARVDGHWYPWNLPPALLLTARHPRPGSGGATGRPGDGPHPLASSPTLRERGIGANIGPDTAAPGQTSPPGPLPDAGRGSHPPPRVGEGGRGERSAPAPRGDPKLAPMRERGEGSG